MGRSRYKITDPQQAHFVTLTVLHWIPVFTRPETVNILLDSLRFLSKEGLKVYAWVILENHCHFVLQSKALDQDIARLKSWTAKNLIQYLAENHVRQILEQLAFYKKAHKGDRAYQFCQEGVHPELIQGDDMMRQKVEYIHQNPVKRGYVNEAEHWRYSSARDYAGGQGLSLVPTLLRGNAYGNGRTRFPRRSMGTSGSRWESLVPALLRPSFPRALRGNAYGTAYGA